MERGDFCLKPPRLIVCRLVLRNLICYSQDTPARQVYPLSLVKRQSHYSHSGDICAREIYAFTRCVV